ncbi:MAG: hypothetical protein PWP64_1275 [Candidatus Cloacimonadota bacterium]|nr:hypothetical protein [Candidatus Cloacimonadota bacterium]
MAKVLSLRLNYKGKFLDYAKEGKEIKKSFFIGSNKFLQWQILEPSFPDKHQFIKQKGGEYVMQLLPGSKLSCEKDGKQIDNNYLKQNNLLSGNELVLKEDVKGTLTISPNWSVDFDFREPWVAVLTPEEKAIVAQYARRSRPDAVTRFNRTIIWLVFFLAIIFLLIFDLVLKPEYKVVETVEQQLNARSPVAQRVMPDITAPTSTYSESTPEQVPAEEGETSTNGPTGTPRGSSSLTSALQGFDANAVGTAPTYDIVTVAEGFVANKPGGGGSGSGPGIGGGPGIGSGAGSSYNPTDTPSFANVGAVVTNAPATQGYSQAPEGAQGVLVTGDASTLAPSGEAWGDILKQQKVAAEYERRGISTVSESSISRLDESTRTRYTSLREQIASRQSQIEQVYREMQIRQSVSFTITIYVRADGTVRESTVVPQGSYPENFVARVKEIIDGWKFNVNEEMAYQFKIRAG